MKKYYEELEYVFSRYVSEYDNWYFKNVDVAREELELVKSFNLKGVGIEIGAGTCFFSKLFKDNIIGLDLSFEMCRFCKKARDVECIHVIGEYLPIRSCSLDYVLIIVTLCFIDDVHRVLEECYRVLRNEGEILICIVPKDSEVGKNILRKRSKDIDSINMQSSIQ